RFGRRSDGTVTGPGELRIGLDRTGARATKNSQVGRAVLGVLAEGLEGPRQDVPEVPLAHGLVRPERSGLQSKRPERVELRSLRLHGAAHTRRGVTQDLRRADVGLELDLRVRPSAGLERPDVLERGRMSRGAVRPRGPLVRQSVEVQVTVLVPVVETLVGGRRLRGRDSVDRDRPRPLLEAVAVGEFAVRAAVGVVGRTGHRPVRPFGRRVLADTRFRVAWTLTGLARAFGSAHAGVEDLRVAVARGARAERERVLVLHRVTDLG